jgi:DNA-binding NarL/FixJ family response regulator
MGYKDIVVTDSGRKCLDEALKITHSQPYLIIILDTHLKDIPVTEVAKKIIDRKPNQHIVLQLRYRQIASVKHLSQQDLIILRRL